jgi:hypothetical protein
MAKIPSHIMQSARHQGVDIPDGVFHLTSRAAANALGDVAEIPAVFKKELDRAQDIRNRSDISDRLRSMREMQAEYLQTIQRDQIDPSDWAPGWEKKLKSFEKTLSEGGVPPVVVRGVTEQFKDFAGKSMLTITGAALKENRRRAQGHFDLDYQDAIAEGRYNDADGLVDDAVSTGVLDDLQGREYKTGTKNRRRQDDLDTRLLDDPMKYKEDLPQLFPHSKAQQLKEAQRADSQISKYERDEVELIRTLVDSGVITDSDQFEEELEMMQYISKERKKIMSDSFNSNQEVPFEEESGFIDRVHDLHAAYVDGQIDFETYRKGYDEMSSEADAYGTRLGASRMKSVLRSRDPQIILQNENEEAAELAEDELKEQRRKRAAQMSDTNSTVSQLVRNRIEGRVKATVAGQKFITGTHDVKKAEFQAAQEEGALILRKALEREVQRWAEQKDPPPTDLEIQEYLDKVQPTVIEQISQGIPEEETMNGADRANEWLKTNGPIMLPRDGSMPKQ